MKIFSGALFHWRLAVGLFCIPPILSLIILSTVAPETPRWLMSKGREKDALNALIALRGEKNKYIVDSELKSIKENTIRSQKNEQYAKTYSILTILKKYSKIMTDPTFLKPFGVLLLVFAFACEWTGAINLQAYFVSIMRYVRLEHFF